MDKQTINAEINELNKQLSATMRDYSIPQDERILLVGNLEKKIATLEQEKKNLAYQKGDFAGVVNELSKNGYYGIGK